MTPIESVHAAFPTVMQSFNRSPAICFLESGLFTLAHYKSYLRELYHYTKEDPQIQALASVYFRGSDRHSVKLFLRHAISEVGHDILALKDLEALGEKPADIFLENPLPATIALTAYPFYEINYRNPISYLGYLYFLEYMPTQHGRTYAAALSRAGVPEEAMGFLKEHMHADVGHNKLMEKYLACLLHDQKDADSVIYAMHVTADLYTKMLSDCIERVDRMPHYGISWDEAGRIKSGDAYEAEEFAEVSEENNY